MLCPSTGRSSKRSHIVALSFRNLHAEKLTLQTFLGRIATEHTLPFSFIRGMSSLTPKREIFNRYGASRKDTLILLVVSDLDPAGDAIAEDLVKSFGEISGSKRSRSTRPG
jgi:hypothetical protein